MHKLRGIIYIVISAILYGIMPIWVKLAYTTGLTAFDVTFLRSGLAAIVLGIYIFYRRIDFHISRIQLGPLLVSSIIGYAATNLTLYLSYNYVSAGVATSLHYLCPVLVMLISFFIYHEELKVYKWLALVMSFSGIFLVADLGGRVGFSPIGVGLAASSAVFFAIYTVSLNHPQLIKVDSLVLAFYACIGTSLTSFIMLMLQGSWPPVVTAKGLYYTSLVSIFCTALALIFFIKAVQIIGSANASILSTLEPVVSLIAGILILSEPLTWFTALGCILIVAAAILLGVSDLKRNKSSHDQPISMKNNVG